MACCEYRNKSEENISKKISSILLIIISFFLLIGLIFFGIFSFLSKKSEKIADFCYWGLISISKAPGFFASKWQMDFTIRTFIISPFLSGWLYKNFSLAILLFFNLIFIGLLVKIVLFMI